MMEGVDTVVTGRGLLPESSWEAVLGEHHQGAQCAEGARDAGVRQVVLASSNHAMGMYDRYEQWPVYDQLQRADSCAASEGVRRSLGRFYHDEHGLDVINLRIGCRGGSPPRRRTC